jgi:hypothetical protein
MPNHTHPDTRTDRELLDALEQQAYDTWIKWWCESGCVPTLTSCPARYMEGERRTAYLKGWNRALREFRGDQQ